MAQAKTADDRWFPRYHSVLKEFWLEWTPVGGGPTSDARLLDVSRDGLGLLAPQPLQSGAIYEVTIDGRPFKFNVVYCIKDLIHPGEFRIGAQRVGSSENLVSLFAGQGCIEI